MTIHLANISGLVLVYFLVFARTGAMLMLLPPISQAGIPARVRLVLALAVSVAMAPTVLRDYPSQGRNRRSRWASCSPKKSRPVFSSAQWRASS
jgi:flagellar biosynthesis protein FliR